MLVDAHGRASADDAWLRFTTPATWSVWAPLIREVEASEPRLAAGTTGRVSGPPGVAVDFEVTHVDPDLRSWSWRAGRGPAAVHMDHHVVPAAGGGSRAFLRVPGTLRAPAPALPHPGGGRPRRGWSATAAAWVPRRSRSPPSTSPSHPRTPSPARPFGITPRSTTVEVGPAWLFVRFGPWRLLTPRSNIASAEVTGGFSWAKTAGPPHLSLSDRGVSFTTNGDRALCLSFHEPVPAIDPTATITHPGATLSVADPEGLADALGLPA